MPTAIRVIDVVAEMGDWDQSSFSDGQLVRWNATSGKYEGVTLSSSSTNLFLSGVTEPGVGSGFFLYVSGNDILSLTDSSSYSSSLCVGVSTGTAGSVIVSGVVQDAQFTTTGGMPQPGSPVWLASSLEEAFASGKLTATAPTSGINLQVGVCVNNANYPSGKTAKIVLSIGTPILL